ncbi:MAG: hypothetical protein NTW33_01940 [Methanoregula sp.]|nr:hypothetical protein [Methanoregula sp.]
MTRGRPPLVALKEAYLIAMKRGQVMPVSEGRCDHFHFILFSENRITFVKVKRTLSEISDSKEILQNYEREIRHLARVPLNAVDAREFWVRSPRGTFHFFLIEKDRIRGLQADGSVMTGIDYPLEVSKPKGVPALPAGKDSAVAQMPILPEPEKNPVPEQVPTKEE